MKTFDYNSRTVFLKKEEYRNNGTLAVLMFKENGELYCPVTVNLNHSLQSDSLAFIDESSLPGIGKWLSKNKCGEFTGYEAYSESRSYPLYELY